MDVREPQKRRRGFFLHSESGEPDTGDYENAEGFAIRTVSPVQKLPDSFRASAAAGPTQASRKAAPKSDQGA